MEERDVARLPTMIDPGSVEDIQEALVLALELSILISGIAKSILKPSYGVFEACN